MKRKLSESLIILIIFQLFGCITIYHSVRDSMERSYKEGVELYTQNRIEEANDRFETVAAIEPEYRYVKQYLAQTRRLVALKKWNIQQRANEHYDRGSALMKSGRYADALPLLILAKEQDPDHVDVDDKIDECRKKLAPNFEYLLKVAEWQYRQGQYLPAYNTCRTAKVYDPPNIQLYFIIKKIEAKLTLNAEIYLDRGKIFYDKKQYKAALTQYQFAQQSNPWDKDIQEIIERINAKINLDTNYQNGIARYNTGDYFGAKALFNMVNLAETGYRDTAQYLIKINNALSGQVGYFYYSGVANYDKGNYEAAIIEFNKVLSIYPGNTNAQEYRQRSLTKLEIKRSIGEGTK